MAYDGDADTLVIRQVQIVALVSYSLCIVVNLLISELRG